MPPWLHLPQPASPATRPPHPTRPHRPAMGTTGVRHLPRPRLSGCSARTPKQGRPAEGTIKVMTPRLCHPCHRPTALRETSGTHRWGPSSALVDGNTGLTVTLITGAVWCRTPGPHAIAATSGHSPRGVCQADRSTQQRQGRVPSPLLCIRWVTPRRFPHGGDGSRNDPLEPAPSQ